MKRVKSVCILQTLVFAQKPELGLSKKRALKINHEEFDHYKASLERAKTKYQIDSAADQEDGSLIVRVRKQNNDKADVSEYFN